MPLELQVSLYTIILLLFSAFFSAGESSFTALSIAKIEVIIKEKRLAWTKIKYLTDNLDRSIMTCLIMSNLMNIILSAYLTVICTGLFGISKGVTVAVVTGSILILLFGSILPKRLAIQNTELFAKFIAYPLWGIVIILTPLTYPLTNIIKKIWPPKESGNIPEISEAEIKAMVSLGGRSGVINKTSQDFIQNVFTLPKKKVRDIMTPLEKVISVPSSTTVEKLQEIFKERNYYRLPVYEEDLNEKNVRYITFTDFINTINKNSNLKKPIKKFDLPKVLTVPESIIIQELLVIFQNKQQQMALVVNEDLETIGLVTLEDIMEVVFGDVKEEDQEKVSKTRESNGRRRMEVDGEMSIEELGREIEYDFPEKYPVSKSIAWLCLELLGRFPEKGDKISVPDTEITLKILSTRSQKAKKVTVEIKETVKKKTKK